MKLRQAEINAIVGALLNKQSSLRDMKKEAFIAETKQNGKFEELAKLMKENFTGFEDFLNVNHRELEMSIRELAESLREDYVSNNFLNRTNVGLKREHELQNEVILIAPKYKTYEEIIAAITVTKDNDEN